MQALAALGLWTLLATSSTADALFKSKRVANPDIPASSFSCVGRHNGYYADVETDCQVYHMCLDRQQFSYQCPNTTRFQQRMMVCDHWYQVDCPAAPLSYSANLLIGQRDKLFVEDHEHQALHEAAVRTSKGLLKFSQPAPNSLDGPGSTPSARPASDLEAPFEDDAEPKKSSFFQRSPTSSFAQPFQNQLLESPTTAAPVLSFTFTPSPSPAPPRFSISFSPSPSFPASGHNLKRPPGTPAPSTSSPTAPTSGSSFPSAPSSGSSFPSAPASGSSSFPNAPTSGSSFPSPPTSGSSFPSAPSSGSSFPSAPSSSSSFSNAPHSSSSFPTAPTSSSSFPSAPTSGSSFPSAPSSTSQFPTSPTSDSPFPTAPTSSSSFPRAPTSGSSFPRAPQPGSSFPSGPQVQQQYREPSRELEAPPADYPEQEVNDLPPAGPFTRAPASPPSRELTPPLYFGSDSPAPPSATLSAPEVSGGGSPRPFSFFNATGKRLSLFAATAAPLAVAPAPPPPSRELEAPAPAPEDEAELDFNTVELKFQDTRRLFFIPDGGPDPSSDQDADPSPVVVIKYPSKSARGAARGAVSTARLKSYSAEVKTRANPACPRCHPDYVVPGTCSPCVLLH